MHASLHLARKRLVIQLASFVSPNFGKPKYLVVEGARAVVLLKNLLFQFEQFTIVLGRRRHGRYSEGSGADGTGGRGNGQKTTARGYAIIDGSLWHRGKLLARG